MWKITPWAYITTILRVYNTSCLFELEITTNEDLWKRNIKFVASWNYLYYCTYKHSLNNNNNNNYYYLCNIQLCNRIQQWALNVSLIKNLSDLYRSDKHEQRPSLPKGQEWKCTYNQTVMIPSKNNYGAKVCAIPGIPRTLLYAFLSWTIRNYMLKWTCWNMYSSWITIDRMRLLTWNRCQLWKLERSQTAMMHLS